MISDERVLWSGLLFTMSTPRTNFSLCRSTNNTLLYDTATQFYALLYAVPTSILYGVAIYSIKQQASYYSPVYVRLLTLSMTLVALNSINMMMT